MAASATTTLTVAATKVAVATTTDHMLALSNTDDPIKNMAVVKPMEITPHATHTQASAQYTFMTLEYA